MSGWARVPTEEYQLEEKEPESNRTKEYNGQRKDGVPSPFGEGYPSPPGFIYRSLSPQSSDNPYATQPPYNPFYKLVDDTIVPQIIEATEQATVPSNNEQQILPKRQKDTIWSNCLMLSLIAIVIATMGWVVYLIATNPKLARTLQKLAKEARKVQEDEEGEEEEMPLFKKIFSPVISHELGKLINGTDRS